MQSEAGAAGALHGAVQRGALATTFTASQGLLLMLPNMFKIAGELTPAVIHVAARTVATHALSIFGDHSDVMAARTTGFAMLSVVAPSRRRRTSRWSPTRRRCGRRVPFLHFFDGFRTSHEIGKIEPLGDDDLRAMIDDEGVSGAPAARAPRPRSPGAARARRRTPTCSSRRARRQPFHAAVPGIVSRRRWTLRRPDRAAYRLVDYYGAPDADRVIVLMGSGAGAVARDRRRAVPAAASASASPSSGCSARSRPRPCSPRCRRRCARIAVLDRTKEPGAVGEPLHQDVVTALAEAVAGRRAESPMPARHRRTLRPGLEGVHAGDGQGRVRRARRPNGPATTSPSASSTTSATPQPRRRPRRSRPSGRGVRAVFYGLGRDGTVEREQERR